MNVGDRVTIVSSPYNNVPVGTHGTIKDIRTMHFCPKRLDGSHVSHEGRCQHLYVLENQSEGWSFFFREYELKAIA